MAQSRRAVCCLAPLLLFACVRPSDQEAVEVSDIPQLELTEEQRLGSIDDPNLGFSDIGSIGIDSKGQVSVLERKDRVVRVYDRAGRIVRLIGRSGEGPGEFKNPMILGMVGDTVWVNDPGLGRLTLFSPNGSVVQTISTRPVAVATLPGLEVQVILGIPRRDGTFTGGWRVPMPADPPTDSFMIPVVRMDSAGAILDTIRLQPWAIPKRRFVPLGGSDVPVPLGPSDGPLHIGAFDGAYVILRSTSERSGTGTFSVTRISGIADTVFRREFRYEPMPFSRGAMDGLMRPQAAFFSRATKLDTAAILSVFREAVSWPSYQPPVSSGWVGQDTVLWLEREDDDSPTHEWLLISPEGEALGVVVLSRDARIVWSAGNQLWVVQRDELDVPWLVRFEVSGFADGKTANVR